MWEQSFVDKLKKEALKLPIAIESLSKNYASRVFNTANKQIKSNPALKYKLGDSLRALKDQTNLSIFLNKAKAQKHAISANMLAKNIDRVLRTQG